MILVEPHLTHGLVKSEDQRVALFEDTRVHHPLNVVEDLCAPVLHGVKLGVFVLDYLRKLPDLVLVSLGPQLELILSEDDHLRGEIDDAFVEVLEGKHNAHA